MFLTPRLPTHNGEITNPDNKAKSKMLYRKLL